MYCTATYSTIIIYKRWLFIVNNSEWPTSTFTKTKTWYFSCTASLCEMLRIFGKSQKWTFSHHPIQPIVHAIRKRELFIGRSSRSTSRSTYVREYWACFQTRVLYSYCCSQCCSYQTAEKVICVLITTVYTIGLTSNEIKTVNITAAYYL